MWNRMKYSVLRNKQIGDKDLEMKSTYKKKRLQEVRLQELEKEVDELDSYSISDKIDNEVQG